MGLIDDLLARIVPHDCLSCGREGRLVCEDCIGLWEKFPQRCYRCHNPSPGGLTCSDCLQVSDLARVQVATVYRGAAKDLLWRLKSGGAQEAASIMAECMTSLLSESGLGLVIVPISTATGRIRQRGYDQSRLIARQLTKKLRQPYANCLVRSGQAHQVGAGRDQRLRQLEGAFRVTRKTLVRDRHILLLDDVITTGASMELAATELRRAGARQVEAIAFAQALMVKEYALNAAQTT